MAPIVDQMIPATYHIGDSDSRPWGRWVVLDKAPQLVVKKLTVDAGKRISLQRHRFRSERWIVMEGEAVVQRDEALVVLRAGDGIMIPQNCLHRLTNESSSAITVLEVQFGEILSEDDIERFDDDFGRHE